VNYLRTQARADLGGILSGFRLQTYFAIYIGILIFGASESQVRSKRASWANVEGVGDTSDFKLWGGPPTSGYSFFISIVQFSQLLKSIKLGNVDYHQTRGKTLSYIATDMLVISNPANLILIICVNARFL